MGFSVGVLLGVILAGYVLGAFNAPNAHSPRANLFCPWVKETLPTERPITAAATSPALLPRGKRNGGVGGSPPLYVVKE
jgi:hypothetical protein